MNGLDASSALDRIRIQIILASTREGRFGDRVANWFYGLAAKREGLIAELINLRDWPLPFLSESTSPSTGHYAPEAQS
jgi:NAD(P)H-dependent FMN reductase